MSELLYNLASGVLTADPGTSGTTLNSGNFAFLPAVASPNTMRLVIDPDGVTGTPEIVIVTAHTASATLLTATRGQETAFGAGAARAHAVDSVWRHVLTRASILELMVPAASVVATVASTADVGYALIDGSTITNGQTLYPATYARLPASWKSAPNIVLPDWRGVTLFSDDTGATFTLGAVAGANSHAITQAELPAAPVTISPPTTQVQALSVNFAWQDPTERSAIASSPGSGLRFIRDNASSGGIPLDTVSGTFNSGNMGSGAAMSLIPACGVVNWQIKVH
jgi:microcystin-dependent protein